MRSAANRAWIFEASFRAKGLEGIGNSGPHEPIPARSAKKGRNDSEVIIACQVLQQVEQPYFTSAERRWRLGRDDQDFHLVNTLLATVRPSCWNLCIYPAEPVLVLLPERLRYKLRRRDTVPDPIKHRRPIESTPIFPRQAGSFRITFHHNWPIRDQSRRW